MIDFATTTAWVMHAAIAAAPEAAAPAVQHAAGHAAFGSAGVGPWWTTLIPALPLLGSILCLLCAVAGVRSKLPAWLSLGGLIASFALAVGLFMQVTGTGTGQPGTGPVVAKAFDWITFAWGDKPGQSLTANFSFYVDSLTCLWMLFVTGLAALICLYASEYMSHDVGLGYCRFFGAFNIFVFSMACLVMGDNLLVLFLGWEGVGLCSYLLIGYFYKKPAAVAAAKKAFIMNRIGDLGLVLGILATFVVFGTIEFASHTAEPASAGRNMMVELAKEAGVEPPPAAVAATPAAPPKHTPGLFELIAKGVDANGNPISNTWVVWVIPLLLTIGAFGKSAQLFFYVWLPDAMEGPTPVSALIHAATMVTAGVYLIARMYPLYAADPELRVLTFVAWAGAITALWAATIEMAIFDIKRVMGYSTISQLGFMFAGLGLLTPTGAAFHTFTHAFFKATLFLGVGAVMHGFGGQLDLRRLSGVMWMRGFGLVGVAMLIGSINLSGVPFTAGYFSKDIILAEAFARPTGQIGGSQAVAWILLITAGMTAYYTFRTYLRVYVGPKEFVPGDDPELVDMGRHPKGTTLEQWHAEHGHGHGHGHGHEHDHGHGHGHAHDHGHGHGGSVADRRLATRVDFDPTTEEFDPHPPGWAMKTAIAVAMVLSVLAAGLYFIKGAPGSEHGGWVGGMIHSASPQAGMDTIAATKAGLTQHHSEHAHGTFLGMDPHKVMYYVSAGVGFIGILLAALLHGPKGIWSLFLGNRTSAENAPRANRLANAFGPLTKLARNKYYVDEIYDALIVKPLYYASHFFAFIDKALVDGLVDLAGRLPRETGRSLRPSQSGYLHGYAVAMAGGLAFLLLIILFVTT